MLTHLARFGDARGVDMDLEAVGYCHDRGLRQVTQSGADSLPFEKETFDLVTALDVIEHIDDDLGALREMRRVMKPGGLLLLTVPAYMFLWGRQDDINLHKRRYVARQLHSRLEAAGFEVQKLTYMNSILFPAIAAIRLVRRVLPEPPKLESDFAFPAPQPLNVVLSAIFGSERHLLTRFDIPFGVSIMALARAGDDEGHRERNVTDDTYDRHSQH
jgi:SAM-dependent methyltransferase